METAVAAGMDIAESALQSPLLCSARVWLRDIAKARAVCQHSTAGRWAVPRLTAHTWAVRLDGVGPAPAKVQVPPTEGRAAQVPGSAQAQDLA